MNRPVSSKRRRAQLFTAVTIFGPPTGIAIAVRLLWGAWVTTVDLILLSAFYCLTVIGLSAGYHRLFAHYSFQCRPWLRAVLGVCGSMAGEGPIRFWVAIHRKHHRFSDTANDPHSPHGLTMGSLRRWWHAHMGWMFQVDLAELIRHAPELRRDRIVMWLDRHYLFWVLLGLAAPGAIEWTVDGSAAGIIRGVLWGGFVRMFLVQHVTWSINSICHMVGHTPFRTGDQSRNNLLCALLSFGEGWHNNHHAYPFSARHGFRPHELDMTYLLIRMSEHCGVVWGVKVPPTAAMSVQLAVRHQR
jgi:stearoyl-CoA desaturase (delta-9 desaturase)